MGGAPDSGARARVCRAPELRCRARNVPFGDRFGVPSRTVHGAPDMTAPAPRYLFDPKDKPTLPLLPVPLLEADDATMDGFGNVVAFWCDGSRGVYIHPGIWHEGVFPVEGEQRFLDRQGKVHARVSCDFGKEFGVNLSVPLKR